MTDSADVVVVGGGIIGLAIGLHLAEAGLDVIVLERDGVAQATTAAGAGFVGVWAAGWAPTFGEEHVAIERYGLAFYRALATHENGFGYRRNGNLYVATTADSWKRHVAPLVANRAAVPNLESVSPQRIAEITGSISADAVHGGVFHPDGCQLSASRAAQAIARRLVDVGGRIETRRPTTGFLHKAGCVRGVDTVRGKIRAENTVVAAGAWTNALLSEIGIWLPMVPLVAARVVTEPLGIPSTAPTIMIGEIPIYLRGEDGAILWGMPYRERPRFAFVDAAVPERFDQLPLDGVFAMRTIAQRAADIIPALGRAKSMTVAFGAPTFTPDQRPFLGPIDGIRGLLVAAGCNEAGVTHGPAYGQLLAELLVSGSTSLCSLDAFDPMRFGDAYRDGNAVVVGLQRARTEI
jgi:sarcosine oxidase, subunit beta